MCINILIHNGRKCQEVYDKALSTVCYKTVEANSILEVVFLNSEGVVPVLTLKVFEK
jgi:hypothetical protein